MSASATLQGLVEDWLRLDRNDATRDEISKLWAARDEPELEKRLRKRIEFGTAGLRGRMEAGFSRMNDLTVIQASQGLSRYVAATIDNAKDRGVVIGHDHRHNSERFAQLTAAAFLNDGYKVHLLRGLVHTPLVPFSVAQLKAACGVMITASHNPKDDNGYKLYWENGVQIINPHDLGIAASIENNLKPRTWDTSLVASSSDCLDSTAQMKSEYFAALLSLSVSRPENAKLPTKFVNTSMHGVGHVFVEEAWRLFEFAPFIPVQAQKSPDPDFPTVKFPNPEEKGALDLATQQGDTSGSQYVFSQDPDADRFTAAERLPNGTWRQFSGDQIGTLLAIWTLELYKRSGKSLSKLAMVASTVSSKMIEAISHVEGFKFVESLTGFKYIGNTAKDLERQGYHVPFGYEEAIGYMPDTGIKDKDGVAATVFFAEMITWLHSRNLTAATFLDSLYEKYGYFQTGNSYFVCHEPPTVDRIFARLRNWGGPPDSPLKSYPVKLGGLAVNRVRDLTSGYEFDSASSLPDFKPDLPSSGGHMVTFRAKEDDPEKPPVAVTLTIRTSGTEPKIKYYLEATGETRERVQSVLEAVVQELTNSWMEAKKNGIVHA